jgi:hypothetical protein
MNYFKYIVEDKITFRILALVLLLVSIFYKPTTNINIDIKEEIVKHKQFLKEIENEPKVNI